MANVSLPVTISNPKFPEIDGDTFGAYGVMPKSGPAPGIILLHEIFGVTDWIKNTADLFAAQGYCVMAPEIFWRLERNFNADFKIPSLIQREMISILRHLLTRLMSAHFSCLMS